MTRPSYPLAIANGSLQLTSEYPDKVRQAILSAILTKQEERVWRPAYGLEVSPFDSLQLPDVLAGFREAIALGLEGHPGVDFSLKGYLDDSGTVEVIVTYATADSAPAVLTLSVDVTG